MLEAQLSRRVDVVRVPQIGWIRMVRRTLRRAGLLAVFGQAAVTTALGGALGLRILPPPGGRLPALRTSRATASAADNASSTATLT